MKKPTIFHQLKIRNLSYYHLFIITEVIMLIAFNILNLILHGNLLFGMWASPNHMFDDYFMHLGYASAPIGTNVYEFGQNACFPPLAYLMYAFLARCIGYAANNPVDIEAHKNIPMNMIVYVLYTVICIVLLIYAISLFIKKNGFINRVIFPCILILTFPVTGAAIQRGNSALLAVSPVTIAIAWRDD